jgi:hypothetical protein
VDAGCTPTRILAAHLADQISDLAGNDRPPGLATPHFPSPESPKAGTMPATRVSGLTMASAERQSRQKRDIQTQSRRSAGVNLGRFLAEERCITPIWWRRAKFSSSSAARERNIEDRVRRNVVRRMSMGGEIKVESITPIGSDTSRFSRGTIAARVPRWQKRRGRGGSRKRGRTSQSSTYAKGCFV